MAFVNRNSSSRKIAPRPVSLTTGSLSAAHSKDRQKTQNKQVVFCWWPSGPRLPFLPFSASPHVHKRESHRTSSGLWLIEIFMCQPIAFSRKDFSTSYTEQWSCNTWAPASAEAPPVTSCRNLFVNSSYLLWVASWFWALADQAPAL